MHGLSRNVTFLDDRRYDRFSHVSRTNSCKLGTSAVETAPAPTAAPDDAPAPSPLADRLVLSLEAHLEEVAVAVVALISRLERETLPSALDTCTELSVWLARHCQQVVHTLTVHPVILEAISPPQTPPAPAKALPASTTQKRPKPAPKSATAAGPRASGLLHGAVLVMAERQRRFTCAALAEALGEETKAVWQVLERLVKQGVVRREGKAYVYLGKGKNDGGQN